jgi:nickel-dependent lactate racemase
MRLRKIGTSSGQIKAAGERETRGGIFMKMKLKYGSDYREFTLPDDANVTVLEPHPVPEVKNLADALREALQKPLGSQPLHMLSRPATVAVAVPDETRPTPLKALLPPLLEYLLSSWPGLAPQDITIFVGGGLHVAPDAAQLSRILPDAVSGCRIVAHDANAPMRSYGRTSRGTPVEINAEYAAAEYKIVVGQIDPHQFVGFTGGSKGVTVGLASKAMIQHNHSLMSDPGAQVGKVEHNPVRQDLNEAGDMIGIQLAINVVLNPAKQVVALLAGRPSELVAPGAKASAQVYGISVEQPFDLVIASCGGHPKDICLYQAQKGLNLASQCARAGAKIMLLAECAQGVGDDAYYNYTRQFATPLEQLAEFKEHGFRMGAHKAFLFNRTVTRYDVAVVTELDATTLANCQLSKRPLQETLDEWLSQQPKARIAVVPNANTTYFYTA